MVNLKNIFQKLYPYGVFTIPSGRTVYITFDDGPIPEVTPMVLAILARYNVKATFFMVGENIDKHPEVFEQVVREGHSVANHTYNHLKGIKYSLSEYMANVARCQAAIDQRHTPTLLLFRPPYGKAWLWQRRALAKKGYRLIYWDILTRDYAKSVTPEQMLARIKRETRPGTIINFHDSLKSDERMLAVLPQVIEWLIAQGYSLAPIVL